MQSGVRWQSRPEGTGDAPGRDRVRRSGLPQAPRRVEEAVTILVSRSTRVLVQGITGRAGTFYTDSAIQYGSNYVAGVRPGKGGATHVGLPVFDTVRAAVDAEGADASLILVPPHQASAAIIEAIEAEIALAVCVTERVPVHDMLRVKAALNGSPTQLVGPNSQGVLAPGICKIGVMSTVDARPGGIGVVSRSASLTSEIVAQLSRAGLGQSATVGVGGDPVHGIGFRRCLELFRDDPEPRAWFSSESPGEPRRKRPRTCCWKGASGNRSWPSSWASMRQENDEWAMRARWRFSVRVPRPERSGASRGPERRSQRMQTRLPGTCCAL